MGFQLIGAIVLGGLLGHWLDRWQANRTPGWTIGLAMVLLLATLVQLIRQLMKHD